MIAQLSWVLTEPFTPVTGDAASRSRRDEVWTISGLLADAGAHCIDFGASVIPALT